MPKRTNDIFTASQQALLMRIKATSPKEGFNETAIPGMQFICAHEPTAPIQSVYTPSLCVIVQGAKKVTAGAHVLRYGPGDYVVSSVDMPVVGQVTEASPSHPYLCLYLQLDLVLLSGLVGDVPARAGEAPPIGIFVSRLSIPLMESITRLVRLLETPDDIAILRESMTREIHYRLLQGPRSHGLRQLVMAGSQMQRISKAVQLIKTRFDQPLRIEEIAESVNMSVSSFYTHFKQVTQLSPLQYQKRLRLQESRRLMLMEGADAASAAFQVGYESPSHFSREYTRLFGASPMADIKRLRHDTWAA